MIIVIDGATISTTSPIFAIIGEIIETHIGLCYVHAQAHLTQPIGVTAATAIANHCIEKPVGGEMSISSGLLHSHSEV
jgi:hypothetical protein